MHFRRTALGSLFLAALCLLGTSFVSTPPALAAKKKRAEKKEKPSAGPSEREKKLLGWTTSSPSAYAIDRPDYFIRGTVTDFKQVAGSKDYEISALPLEVMSNPQHYVSLEHYKTGITFKLPLNKAELKILKPGSVIEYNQYSKEIPGQEMGHAKLISQENYTEFKPYDVAPVAYLSKPGMEPEQILNALTGSLLFRGSIPKTEELKTALATLSKDKDAAIAAKAKELSTKVFGQ